jgi:hypothetical protein
MAETQFCNESPVPLRIRTLQIFEKAAPAPNHLQKAAAAMVVFFVVVEVTLEVFDTGRQEGHLDRCASHVFFMDLELLDYCVTINWHVL